MEKQRKKLGGRGLSSDETYEFARIITEHKAHHLKNIKKLEQFIDSYQIEHGFDELYNDLKKYIDFLKTKKFS
jgi:hypothetical protein